MAKLNDMQRFIVARNYRHERGQGRESLRSMGYGLGRPMKKNVNGLVNVLNHFHDKYGDSGVSCFIVDITAMKEKHPLWSLEALVIKIIESNGWDVEEHMPHYDYDCSGMMMRNAPSIRKIGADSNRYMVVSRWFVDC